MKDNFDVLEQRVVQEATTWARDAEEAAAAARFARSLVQLVRDQPEASPGGGESL